jgi:hypothetical protein
MPRPIIPSPITPMFLRVACDIGFQSSINAATHNQIAGKTEMMQCRN